MDISPFFTFKDNLDEQVALLKLSQAIPLIQALFIGLQFNAQGVSIWFLVHCLYSEIYSRYISSNYIIKLLKTLSNNN